MSTKGKIKTGRLDSVPPQSLVMREVRPRPETADVANRTVQVVVATENPIERYCETRRQIVREVLRMDGVRFRGERRQLPIVDSHDRTTVANVLGSVRNLRIEGDELVGDASFASDQRSQDAFSKLLDGHLTDFSITASPREIVGYDHGQIYRASTGEDVAGPVDVVMHWIPTDASLCAAGADERSTVRRSYTDLNRKVHRMDAALTEQLQTLGVPEGMTDDSQVIAFLAGKLQQQGATETDAGDAPEVETTTTVPEPSPEETPTEEEEKTGEAVERALRNETFRRKEIAAVCAKFNIERAFADHLIDNRVPLAIARKQIMERMPPNPLGQTAGTRVEVTAAEQDKFHAAVRDGMILRAVRATGARNPKPFGDAAPAPGATDFARYSLLRCAEACLRQQGFPIERMSNTDIAQAAFGNQRIRRQYIQRDGEAYHTTGSFKELLLNTANKSMLTGYEEAPFTWEMWARRAASFTDFKPVTRLRLSEAPDLEVVPENHDYPEAKFSEKKESYSIDKLGRIFSVTWEAIVNDDLDALSRLPAMFGSAARRTQNRKVYGVLTANALMADDVPLFHADHGNLAGSGAAPTVTTLNAAYVAMMTQTGVDGTSIINVTPRYIIAPVALSATILELLGSIANPANAQGNPNVTNIYGPGGPRPLVPIFDPMLDANSTTAWYLAADPAQVDTVELAFLEGEETPVTDEEEGFSNDTYRYKIRQSYGVAAVDYRGLYKNPGA